MKKLTVGSMIEGQTGFSYHQSIQVDKMRIVDIKRILEIEQNFCHYQLVLEKDQSILDAALGQQINLDYKCKKGTCGQCKVKIVNGRNFLRPINNLEEKKLQHLLHNGFRLACQATAR